MIRILFLGNSFTFFNDLPKMLTDMAADGGDTVQTGQVLRGGAFLHEFADPRDELYAQVEAACADGPWDHIVLQDQSCNPARDPQDFFDAADKLCGKMECSRGFLFYSTWGYQPGSQKLSDTGMSFREMGDALTAAYRTAAQKHGALRVRVGEAFAKCTETYPDLNLYCDDGFHPNPWGTYLAACLFCQAVTGKHPAGNFIPEGLTAAQCRDLRSIAALF